MGQAVVHFEIGGPDGKQLQSFYAKQFGWKVDASNPMQYGVVDTATGGKGINGGISASMEQGPPMWVTFYIEVPKIDVALTKIEQAGGRTVVPRTVIPGMVTFAQFADPAGNVVGLVESDMPPAEGAAPAPAKKASKKKAAGKKKAAKKASKKKAAKKSSAKKASKKKAAKKAVKKSGAKKASKKKAANKSGAKKASKKKAAKKKAAR